jgi:S-DNA-T family DNA segregation ATPase FtsK/SpoIIIE
MSDLDVQQVLGSRYRTSQEADRHTDKLRQNLNLETKAQVARLAIGRSLALGPLKEETADAKGLDIPASSLFNVENIAAWLGLIVTHSQLHGGQAVDTMDGLRVAIRGHWHRGALALWGDWIGSEENYDRFIETLIVRRSEMPEFSAQNDEESTNLSVPKNAERQDLSKVLEKSLEELGIKVQIKDVTHGPRITRYKVLLMNLSDSAKLKRNMSSLGLALNLGNSMPTVCNGDEAKTVFIDLPREKKAWDFAGVERLKEWAYRDLKNSASGLHVYAGLSVTGEDVAFDLAKIPHLLVGGTTGSGKSVTLHSLILSLILCHKPESLQLALIDPKQVEFAGYSRLPHLYESKISTEISQAKDTLESLVALMESRYSEFNQLGVSNIQEARQKGRNSPYVVVVVEEMADLILQEPATEQLIARLAQKARAAGIHLVLATQRPDSETFSGLIRSNIPGRLALTVQKGTESTIILDEKGAEHLLGAGDMLIRIPGEQVLRAHGVLIQVKDILEVVSAVVGKR